MCVLFSLRLCIGRTNAGCQCTLGPEAGMTSIPGHEIDQECKAAPGAATRRGARCCPVEGAVSPRCPRDVAAMPLGAANAPRACFRVPTAWPRARGIVTALGELTRGRKGAKNVVPRPENNRRTGARGMAQLGMQRDLAPPPSPQTPGPALIRGGPGGGLRDTDPSRRGGAPCGCLRCLCVPLPAGSTSPVSLSSRPSCVSVGNAPLEM